MKYGTYEGNKIIVSTKEKDRAGFHTKEFFNCESKCIFIQYFNVLWYAV